MIVIGVGLPQNERKANFGRRGDKEIGITFLHDEVKRGLLWSRIAPV